MSENWNSDGLVANWVREWEKKQIPVEGDYFYFFDIYKQDKKTRERKQLNLRLTDRIFDKIISCYVSIKFVRYTMKVWFVNGNFEHIIDDHLGIEFVMISGWVNMTFSQITVEESSRFENESLEPASMMVITWFW